MKQRRLTMADIRRYAKEAGSTYFDPRNARMFGRETYTGPYEGPGGIYFVQSNEGGLFDPDDHDLVKHVVRLVPFRIRTVDERWTYDDARDEARYLAARIPIYGVGQTADASSTWVRHEVLHPIHLITLFELGSPRIYPNMIADAWDVANDALLEAGRPMDALIARGNAAYWRSREEVSSRRPARPTRRRR